MPNMEYTEYVTKINCHTRIYTWFFSYTLSQHHTAQVYCSADFQMSKIKSKLYMVRMMCVYEQTSCNKSPMC